MFKLFISFLTVLISLSTLASPHVGIIVKMQGNAQLLTNPSTKAPSGGKNVLFEGVYYKVLNVKLGTKVKNGNILRTNKDSKAKIVFKNGDQFMVGQASAFKIDWSRKKTKKAETTVELMYGALRGVVDKDGPRKGSTFKTRDAVMGIRGTDFHLLQKGTSGDSVLSVLRGNIEVQTKNAKKKIEVSKGFSAEVSKIKDSPKVSLVKTTKSDLIKVHKDSVIKDAKKPTEKAVKKEIEELEKKAAENVLKDISRYEPNLYQALKKNKVNDAEEINKIVVGKIFKAAPKKKKKVGIDTLNLDEDAYEEYFKDGEF
ncbi:MAG: hypothetical protein CMJ16_05885 [Peredibacter sp.]|nr:hypothetical protein [Peredibacter sp.]